MDTRMIKISLIILLSLFFSQQTYSQNFEKDSVSLEDARENLRKLIFCKCVYKQYSDELENDGSVGVYMSKLSYKNPPEILNASNRFLDQYFNSVSYKSKGGFKLGVAKCIDLYDSEGLDTFISIYDEYFIRK